MTKQDINTAYNVSRVMNITYRKSNYKHDGLIVYKNKIKNKIKNNIKNNKKKKMRR